MMPIAMEYYPSNVRDGLERLCKQINIDNRRNMTDLNKSAENFFVEFLNLLRGWNLKNDNLENQNRPGFDLIDEKNQIIVQVSSECTHKKIQEALGNSADKVGFHFYFVAIRASYSPREPFDVPPALQFDYRKDVLDIRRLMDTFDGCGIRKQEELSELIDLYFSRAAPLRELDKPAPARDPGIVDELEYFQRNWTVNAFLTNGVPLKNIYYPPQCYLNGNTKERLGLEDAESRLNNSRKKALLILGLPGIGKSTLISRFVSTYPGKRQIIVYRCRKLGIDDWNVKTIYQIILSVLSKTALSDMDLRNSILILDGLDEVAGKETLDTVFLNLITSYYNSAPINQAVHLVITCRENYIRKLHVADAYNYIRLCPFNKEQIRGFCKDYGETVKKTVPSKTVSALCENEAVYGIPLIAYMVLALEIKVNAKSSIVDVYDQIFDPQKGGIYKRPYDLGADTGGEEMWQKLHQLSQDMALWIFHNNFKEADIPKDRLDRFAEECGLEPQKGLDHFRELHHSESGNQSVTFIHRSMMEYFVADAIARQLCPERGGPADNPSEAIYKISGMLYWRRIDFGECAEYLSKMLEAGFGTLEESEKEEVYRKWELAVFQQLEAGVPFQRIPEKIECSFAKRLKAEKVYCSNLIWVLRNLWKLCKASKKIGSYARKQMGGDRYCNVLPLYFQLNPLDFHVWHLSNCDLIDASLHNMYLYGTDLSGADLRGADLRNADLRNADLRGADLCNADLRNADLRGADLRGADLHGADLRGADLRGAGLRGADLHGAHLDNALLDRDSAFKAIEELRVANFDSIRIWDKGTFTIYTRKKFFAAFDK